MKKIYIKTNTKEEYNRVLEKLEAEGYQWQSGSKPTELGYFDRSGLLVLNLESKTITHNHFDKGESYMEASVWLDLQLPNVTVKDKTMMNVLEFAHTIDPNFLGKWKMYEQVMTGNPQDLIGQKVTSIKGGYGNSNGGINMVVTEISDGWVKFLKEGQSLPNYTTEYDELHTSVILTKYYNKI